MIKCWVCGAEATKTRMFRNTPFGDYESLKDMTMITLGKDRRCYCDKCYENHIKAIAEENETYLKIKRKRMVEAAVDKIERQHLDIWDYKEAIEAVTEYNEENPGKFESAAEIIAAIMLIHNHIRIKPQYKVDKYHVDFLLPEEKIALEIDGLNHSLRRAKDAIRDDVIRYQLGKEWQVVRLPAKGIEKNAKKIIEAIDAVLDYRYDYADKWLKKRG